ncbi:hypothetical protein GCM10008018_38060 [Paenibacillus marchantiophytorum]|uniref:Uncharacterized protein n=1 Tax=Paenibacillus marchantiophytorum TaxID=1619310 RepID=A0ABQ1EUU7_9BACL|nr:hypothetical protein GCM10008018_38060 [Paenibacillus marchantiophytorum]
MTVGESVKKDLVTPDVYKILQILFLAIPLFIYMLYNEIYCDLRWVLSPT